MTVDITERKKAEETLRESEARFRALVQASSDVVYRMSPDWDQMHQLSGRDFIADTETPSNTWLQKYIHPDDQPLVTATINEAIRNKSIFELEHRVLRVDGSLGWTFSRAIQLQDQNGEVVEWFGAASNITERKQAEEELRNLNRILRALSDTNLAAIHADDVSGFLNAVCRIIVEDCGHPMVWIGFAEDDENKTVRPVAQAGFEEGYLESINITWSDTELGRGPTGTAIRVGTPDVCRNMLTESRMQPWRDQAIKRGYASSVALPLTAGGQTLGVLTIYSKEADAFPGGEVKLLAELADDLAYGITVLRLRFAHQQSEEKLRESQARLNLALRSAGMGAWHWDITGNRRYFDDQACYLLGIDPRAFTGTAEEFFEVVHPDDRETVMKALARTLKQDVPYETEYRVAWPDGDVRYITARGKLVRDDEGRPVRLNGIIWDISERKRAEETLRTTVQRFHEILSNIFVGILVVTEDDRIEFANQNLCEQFDIAEAPSDLLGLSAEEMLQKVLPAYAEPEEYLARIQQILSQGHRIEDEEVLMRYGQVLLRDYIPILVDGKPRGRMWQHRDITGRKRAEEELRKAHDELELRVRERTAELIVANEDLHKQAALLNLARDAIFVRGLDHTVKFWNDGATELYGFSREEALGKVTQVLLRSEFPEPLEQIVDQVLDSGWWEGESRQTAATGEEILVESRWALQRGTDGEPLGFLEINRDITARRLAEEALRSNMARLELVNAELQEFAFVAAHDLQEPLRKIHTFCDMAVKRCAPVLDSTGKDYLNRVVSSAIRMRQLLQDLLEFSRVAMRPDPLKRIDLVKIVREAADVFEASVKQTGCQIEIEDIPAIEADESQMSRLFQNLIGNALKFRGGETPRIKVYGKLDGKRTCEIFVKDNGIGFAPKFAELIFKPFQRLHSRGEYDGTGMGLAICRKIVERHGGSIRAESEPGKGSTFIIRLPVKQNQFG